MIGGKDITYTLLIHYLFLIFYIYFFLFSFFSIERGLE